MYNVWIELAGPLSGGRGTPVSVAMVGVSGAMSTMFMVDPALKEPTSDVDEKLKRVRVVFPTEAELIAAVWGLLDTSVQGRAKVVAWNAAVSVWPRLICRSIVCNVRPPIWAVGDPAKNWPAPVSDPAAAWFCGARLPGETVEAAEAFKLWSSAYKDVHRMLLSDAEVDKLAEVAMLEDELVHRMDVLESIHEFIYGYR
jgi:hypothetical protein